jgi:circadian clock protein KaiB
MSSGESTPTIVVGCEGSGPTGAAPRETRELAAACSSSTQTSCRRTFCESELAGRYELEVIDIYQQPTLGAGEQIVAAPTLIKQLPLPVRRLVGDLSDRDRVLLGLDLRAIERSG